MKYIQYVSFHFPNCFFVHPSLILYSSVSFHIIMRLAKFSVTCQTTSNPYVRHKICHEPGSQSGIVDTEQVAGIYLLFIVMLTCPWNTALENMPSVLLVRLIAIDGTFYWGAPLATALPDGTTPRDPEAGGGPSTRGLSGGKACGLLIAVHRIPQGQMTDKIMLTPQNLGHVLLLFKTSCRITRDAVNTFVSWHLCDQHTIDTSLHQLSTHAAPNTMTPIGFPLNQTLVILGRL